MDTRAGRACQSSSWTQTEISSLFHQSPGYTAASSTLCQNPSSGEPEKTHTQRKSTKQKMDSNWRKPLNRDGSWVWGVQSHVKYTLTGFFMVHRVSLHQICVHSIVSALPGPLWCYSTQVSGLACRPLISVDVESMFQTRQCHIR